MHSTLELRWDFTPTDLFEEDFSFNYRDVEVHVTAGTVVALMPTVGDEAKPPLRFEVEQHVEGLFYGAQLVDHTQWSLSRPSVCIVRADGTRNFILEIQPGIMRIRGGRVDLRATNSDGTVVDTKRDRIDRKLRLGVAAATLATKDETLARMMRSYRTAVADAPDELIHLFEVRDSIARRFGNQSEALRQLRFPKPKWSRFGLLCNELPLREGRHRGRFGPEIRPATEAELAEARAVALDLIESYIQYIRAGAA